ncbi:sulfotransferase 1A1-like [Watersipora subatra]|uniref:sulfotransferase 1A1-like n=1 Tax=Watersipora subatra TaxID=2589382 RepID=UPI00355BEA99
MSALALPRKVAAVVCVVGKLLTNLFKVSLGVSKELYGMCDPFQYKDVWFSSMIHSRDRTVASESYDNFRPDDVVIATYPKTGTLLVHDIIESIYKEKGMLPRNATFIDYTTLLEVNQSFFMTKSSDVEEGELVGVEGADSPRIIITHLPWTLLPPNVREGRVKTINCLRNPKDVLCSMYPFYKKLGYILPTTEWQEFIEWFIQGNVIYGSYFRYVKEWWYYRSNQNLLNLQFETMQKDLKGNIKKVAKFLGLELSEWQLMAIVEANTFENRKNAEGLLHPMHRRGQSGAWKTELTVQQNDVIDDWIYQEMKDLKGLKLQFG